MKRKAVLSRRRGISDKPEIATITVDEATIYKGGQKQTCTDS